MSTAIAVLDGAQMTDMQLGKLTRRCDELKRRISCRSLSYELVMRQLQRTIEHDFHGVPTDFTLTVNYEHPLYYAIGRGGYDVRDARITDIAFPKKRNRIARVNLVLMKFRRNGTASQVVRRFEKLGLRPAELPELLAFGELYPDVQLNFTIVALGSIASIKGNRLVPILTAMAPGGKRILTLINCEEASVWNDSCYFAATSR
jgi:hypothetical protein